MKYPFVKCLNPLKVVNPYTHEPLVVGCGKCPACLLQKSSMRTLKCKLESLSHAYTYFITLTYSNDYIPRMIPIKVSDIDIHEKRKFAFVDSIYKDEIISECNLSLSELDMLYKKCNLGNTLPYLSVRDAQLFLKRFRKHLLKYSNEKIRYYLVGEYGPIHFRPHYHLELWFSDPKIAENLGEIICKSWRFGRFSFEKSRGQSASYVAGYLNSSCNLPSVFKSREAKPFSCHSFFLGEAILQKSKAEVYSSPTSSFIERCYSLDGTSTRFFLWRSFTSRYYPRCPRFSTLNSKQRFESYLTYESASEVFGKTSPYILSKTLVYNIVNNYEKYASFPIVQYFKSIYKISPYLGGTQYDRVVRSIYMELRVSHYFLFNICDSSFLLERFNKLHLIEDFYSRCELLNIKNQLRSQYEYETEYSDYDSARIFYYDNLYFDADKFKQLMSYRCFKEYQTNRYTDSVKHKRLNDLNNIFLAF